MSRNKIVRFGAVLMAAMFLFCGCSNNSSTEVSPSPAEGSEFDPANVERKDPFEKYDPPIEINVVSQEMPFLEFAPGDDVTNNDWTRAYEEELGIKVNFMWVSDPSQFQQKTELMLAGGDLPDLFTVSDLQFQQCYDAGLIEDLSQAYLEYASDDTKNILTEAGPYAIDACIRDGKMMALPFTGNQIENIAQFGIRTDWLDALGLSFPTTLQEYEDALIAFAKQDPDKNGEADTFSLLLDKTAFSQATSADNLFFCYDAYPSTWYDDGSGQLVWGGVQPNAKKGLEAYKRLYDAGAIYKEFNTIDYNRAKEFAAAGKVGSIIDGYYNVCDGMQGYVNATGEVNGDFWQSAPLMTESGEAAKLAYDTKPTNFHVIRKGYEHPEAAVKFMNMWIREFYINTLENDRYYQLIQNESGTNAKWNLALCQAYRPINNINNYRLLKKWNETGDQSYFDQVTALGKNFYNSGMRYKNEGALDQWFWWIMICPEYSNPAMEICSTNIEENNLQPNLFYGVPTTTMDTSWKLLCEKQAQAYQSIIMGGSIDDFDKFVDEWNAMGGEQITKEVNEWYANHKNAADNIFVK